MKISISIFFLLIVTTFSMAQEWTGQSNVWSSNRFAEVTFADDTTCFVAGGTLGIGEIMKSTDGGTSWIPLNSGTTFHLSSVDFVNKDTGYVAGWNGTILKTTNGGNSWTALVTHTNSGLNCICFINENIGFAAGENGALVKTIDGGDNWMLYDPMTSETINQIVFTDTLTGYLVTSGSLSGYIYKTITGGDQWANVYHANNSLSSIYFSSKNKGFAVGAYGEMLMSIDAGDTWYDNNSGNEVSLYSISFMNETTGYAVGNFGTMLYSNDGGQSWNLQPELTNNDLLSVCFDNENSGLVCGNNGTILKYTDNLSISVKKMDNHVVSYPNPCTDFITLKFPQNLNCNYRIYNTAGVILRDRQITEQTMVEDLRDLPAGVYILQLESKSYSESLKVVKM